MARGAVRSRKAIAEAANANEALHPGYRQTRSTGDVMPSAAHSARTIGGRSPPSAVPAFALLFSVALKDSPSGFSIEANAENLRQAAHITPFPPAQLAAYQRLRDEAEAHVLGSPFLEAGRQRHWPLGQIAIETAADAAQTPAVADVHLFTHVAGVALWEIWVPGSAQAFDVEQWIAWLDADAPDGLPARVWRVLEPVNHALGASVRDRQYLPCSVVRLPDRPLAALTDEHAADLIRLLWRDRSTRPLKPDVVEAELARDYCAREGGITLLGRRGALDIHGNEDDSAQSAFVVGTPPRSAMPFIVTLELLLLERAVLLHLYERLSQTGPTTIEGLLALKREVTDSLEEYYGATLASTRFGDAVAEDGERLLGIVDAYDAVMDRLETVSFTLTTRYQQRMTEMQFWLTVVFGATEIGFIASGIATWFYRNELGAVLAWTIGAALATAVVLVALLRGRIGQK